MTAARTGNPGATVPVVTGVDQPTATRTLTQQDQTAIRALVERASGAQSNPDTLLPMHTADAVIVNFFGRRILGRDAFGEAMRAALSTSLSDVTTTVEILDIRAIAESVALVSCLKTAYDGRIATEGAELPATVGALTYVVTRADGVWSIALAQTTPILS